MDCACGHPIFQKSDRMIIRYKGESHYLHIKCAERFFTVHPSGHSVPTVEYLEIIGAKKAEEAQERAIEEQVQG